jgi:HAD superfamily hydrolase (TIGR01490 family)
MAETNNKKTHTPRKVAFFDIDGTVFRSSLLIELVDNLIQEGIFPKTAEKFYRVEKQAWLDRQDSYEKYIEAVVASFIKHIKNVPYKSFMEVAEDIVEKNKDHLYVYTRDLIKDLKKRGYFLIAISQSPKGVLSKFCANLGFDKVYGRLYELGPEDQFTGEVTDVHLIENKANIVKRAVEKENLTLKNSFAVGDTEGDIPMLELVENPICFNPNSKLYKYAKINKWTVMVERKDVVYEIK